MGTSKQQHPEQPPADTSPPARLELTWPNKDKFLLVPKDVDGKPIWVERDHPAAAEVRIHDLDQVVGQVDDANPYGDNLLFTGDSLDVLRILAEVPEFRREYRGTGDDPRARGEGPAYSLAPVGKPG